MARKFLPNVTPCKEVFLINNAFRAWGHQFLYDRVTVEMTMKKVGFQNMRYYRPGVSDDDNLRGIESHGSVMGCEEINQFEAFAVEGDVLIPKSKAGMQPAHSDRPFFRRLFRQSRNQTPQHANNLAA